LRPNELATRKELIEAVDLRYRSDSRTGKTNILNEFVELTGTHRKHAIRVLGQVDTGAGEALPKQRNRVYDEAVRQSLIMLWDIVEPHFETVATG